VGGSLIGFSILISFSKRTLGSLGGYWSNRRWIQSQFNGGGGWGGFKFRGNWRNTHLHMPHGASSWDSSEGVAFIKEKGQLVDASGELVGPSH